MNYVIGIDGGGSKTLLKIAGMDGEIIFSTAGASCNIYSSGVEEVAGMLKKLIIQSTRDAGLKVENCKCICIGTAGAGRAVEQDCIQDMIRRADYGGRVIVTDDVRIVMRAAVGREGIALISGTGSICMGSCSDGRLARSGGWGHIIGDEGSAYAAAVGVFSAVMRAYDGRGRRTALTGLLLEKLDLQNEEQLIAYVYSPGTGKREIAPASELLKPACAAGDEVARSIVLRSAEELFGMVSSVAQTLDLTQTECVLATNGGFINYNPYLRNQFIAMVHAAFPFMQTVKPEKDAADGAVLIALDEVKNPESMQ